MVKEELAGKHRQSMFCKGWRQNSYLKGVLSMIILLQFWKDAKFVEIDFEVISSIKEQLFIPIFTLISSLLKIWNENYLHLIFIIHDKNSICYIIDLQYDFRFLSSHFELVTCHLFIILYNSTKNKTILGDQKFSS
jgi:hypothetical protein